MTAWNSIILHRSECCLFCREPLGTAPRESRIQLGLYHNDLLPAVMVGTGSSYSMVCLCTGHLLCPSPWCWLLCGLLPVSPELIPTGASTVTTIVAASTCSLKATMFRRSVFAVELVSGSFRDPATEGQGVNRPF